MATQDVGHNQEKGWNAQLDDSTLAIPTREQAVATEATDETKALFKSNAEAYDKILMGGSGVPLGLVRRADVTCDKH